MSKRRAFLLCLVLSGALSPVLGATGAWAKGSPGVHVDPGSPAAKEYAIPLGSARGNGTPGRANTGQLFGQGITKTSPTATVTPTSTPAPTTTSVPSAGTAPARTAPARAAHRRSSRRQVHRGQRRRHRSPSAAGSAGGRPRRPASARGANSAGSSSGSGITWMVLAAVAVLALGGLGGALLSRRGRRPDPYPG